VVFGKVSTKTIDLSSIAAGIGGGFAINGGSHGDKSGFDKAGVGDVNGDGLADLIVSPPLSDPSEDTHGWGASVVFGKASTKTIDLSSMAAGIGGGFAISGGSHGDKSNYPTTGEGDVNGDGLADLIVSPPLSDPSEDTHGWRAYVLFGKASTKSIDLSAIAAGISNGFAISDQGPGEKNGYNVVNAGDVNSDGLADLIVGPPSLSDWSNWTNGGLIYVVFGKASTASLGFSSDSYSLPAISDGYQLEITGDSADSFTGLHGFWSNAGSGSFEGPFDELNRNSSPGKLFVGGSHKIIGLHG
jgi:hypothetical protein